MHWIHHWDSLFPSVSSPSEALLRVTPRATVSRCGFRLAATSRQDLIQSTFSNIDLLLPSHNKLPERAGEMLLRLSVTVASQISLGCCDAGGQQINAFHHRSISPLGARSVYWTTTLPLRLLLETIDAFLQWNEYPEFISPIRSWIGTTQNNCVDGCKWETKVCTNKEDWMSKSACHWNIILL